MPRRAPFTLILIASGVCLAARAGASEVGTCLTKSGIWLAPWTDAFDPACGSDCGLDGLDLDTEIGFASDGAPCDDEGEQCLASHRRELKFPAPIPLEGPRCLEPGPRCQPSGTDFIADALGLTFGPAPSAVDLPRRQWVVAIGADPPISVDRPIERNDVPEPPPPRVI